MKIAYFIYVDGHGRGGHFYSLYETASKISLHEDLIIVSIGVNKSPVYSNFKKKYYHLKDEGLVKTCKNIIALLKDEKIDIIHAFDTKSFLFSRIVSMRNKLPLLLTKCGGPNPKGYYPYHTDIVLFSQENKDYFKSKSKFKGNEFPIIANRVDISSINKDSIRINELKKKILPDIPVVLRVARIGKAYKKSILQGINLVKVLNEKGYKVQFLCVGVIQDSEVYEELYQHKDDYIHFETSDRYTVNASGIIDIADIVIGTGRSFMEGALLDKVMLSPTINFLYPILVSPERVEDIFTVNFSPRYKPQEDEQHLLNEVLSLLDDFEKEKSKYSIFKFASEEFSSEELYNKYLPFYEKAQPAQHDYIDLVLHIMQQFGFKAKLKKLLCLKK